jgi:hypothetical protein
MKVGSNEILDLDEEMESKLLELEQSTRANEKNKLSISLNRQNDCEKKTRFIKEAKISKKLKRQGKFDDIENEFDEMVAEDEVQHNVIKSFKGLNGSIYKGPFHTFGVTKPKD